jgi:hypothetical protein
MNLISYTGLLPTKPLSGQEGPNIPLKKSRFSASRGASSKAVEDDDPEARIDSKAHAWQTNLKKMYLPLL